MNRFEDTIPEAFGSNLRRLSLNGNKIGGSLPLSLLNCSKLQVLDVGSNKLDDIFPQWLESLAELQLLVLRSNKFHGDVRGSNANKNLFSKLKIFDLSRNNFNGPPTRYIENFKAMMNVSGSQSDEKYSSLDGSSTMKGSDIEMVKMFTPFAAIDLSYNKFEGEIPKVIGELKSLSSLSLSHNSFTGQIPASTGQLTGLEWLDLSYNHLSGEIPIELENLTFLSYLDLSWNNLTGPIPKRRQFGTFGNESYEGNMGLCGFPLTNRCRDDEGLEPPPLINFQQEAKRVFLLLSVFGFVLFFICTI
ncbi:receptor-like protein 9DC3 [Ziziphus jujuba]|uniref:Receptor-like protein 9DC3 n=1 Tax=Ziziphus jujuba TaxID=326968 RepID=A0ABM3IA57_ZIZJJ|nr:receptor-like protein 9DC3 [Ziziphus jujuba]